MVLYVTSTSGFMSSSFVIGKCILNSLRFGDAPSQVTARTLREFSSQILMAFQRRGNIWLADAPDVAKFARLNLKGLTMLRIRNANMWVAMLSVFFQCSIIQFSVPQVDIPNKFSCVFVPNEI